MANITINGITLDPIGQQSLLSSANLAPRDASASGYILVQTNRPLGKGDKAQLEAAGATILEYVPEDTLLCAYPPSHLGPVRALPFVAWADVYLRGFKVAPSLVEEPAAPAGRTLMEMAARPFPLHSKIPKSVDVVVHDNVNPESIRDRLAAAAGIDPQDIQLGRHKARLTVPQEALPELANIDEVRHIEEVFPNKLHNNVARRILNIDGPNLGGGFPFEGNEQIVAVADTGFDHGSTVGAHPAFQNRVIKLYALGRVGKTNDPNGHGTHVAGSVLGDGNSAVLGHRVRGTAPLATAQPAAVVEHRLQHQLLPNDLTDLLTPPYQTDGARVHTGPANERHGNVPPHLSGFDRSNNVEQVVWAAPPAGTYTVTIRAHRVPRHPQSYALVVRVV